MHQYINSCWRYEGNYQHQDSPPLSNQWTVCLKLSSTNMFIIRLKALKLGPPFSDNSIVWFPHLEIMNSNLKAFTSKWSFLTHPKHCFACCSCWGSETWRVLIMMEQHRLGIMMDHDSWIHVGDHMDRNQKSKELKLSWTIEHGFLHLMVEYVLWFGVKNMTSTIFTLKVHFKWTVFPVEHAWYRCRLHTRSEFSPQPVGKLDTAQVYIWHGVLCNPVI